MKLVKEAILDDHKNQMSLLSETDEVIKFLETAGKRSILADTAVQVRLSACHAIFSVLTTGEDNVEYILNNLDLLVHRYKNKHPNMQDNTLKVYKSRLKGSLEDYQEWLKDATGWERSVTERARAATKEKKGRAQQPPPRSREPKAQVMTTEAPAEPKPRTYGNADVRRMSFPIRPDFNLELTIPNDGFSLKELLRLGLFLYPYCKENDGRLELPTAPWPN